MAVERLSFSVPEGIKETLQKLAEKESRSVSSMCTVILKEGIARRGTKKKRPAKRAQ